MAEKQVPTSAKEFAHRCNADGTFDSICLFCFHTVGTATVELELGPYEDQHDCEIRLSRTNGSGPR